MYLPLAAVIVGAVLLLHWLLHNGLKSSFRGIELQKLSGIGLSTVIWAAALLLLGWGTYRRNLEYANPYGIWESVVDYNPQNWRAFFNMGLAAVESGKGEEASKYYERALELAPRNAETHNNYGGLIYRTRPQEAIFHFKEAIRLKSDFAVAHGNLGWAYFNMGQIQEAYDEYAKAQRLDPEFPMIHKWLGMVEIKLGRFEEAFQHLQMALQQEPEDAQAHFFMGVTLESLNRRKEAVDHYRESLRIQPAALGPKANLSRLLSSGAQQ
jgi:tetratricopeptide (TPR) repeat protein